MDPFAFNFFYCFFYSYFAIFTNFLLIEGRLTEVDFLEETLLVFVGRWPNRLWFGLLRFSKASLLFWTKIKGYYSFWCFDISDLSLEIGE